MLETIIGKTFIGLIRLYQLFLSPLFAPCCRFYPSCSEYALTAIRRHGPRCHPLHPGGYDPVK